MNGRRKRIKEVAEQRSKIMERIADRLLSDRLDEKGMMKKGRWLGNVRWEKKLKRSSGRELHGGNSSGSLSPHLRTKREKKKE